MPALNITLRALALRYAKVTNIAVRKAFLDQVAANITADTSDDTAAIDIGAALDAATPDQWLDTIVDAALTSRTADSLSTLSTSPVTCSKPSGASRTATGVS